MAARIEVQIVDGTTMGINREQMVNSDLIRFKLVKGSPVIYVLCPRFPDDTTLSVTERAERLTLFARQSFSQP